MKIIMNNLKDYESKDKVGQMYLLCKRELTKIQLKLKQPNLSPFEKAKIENKIIVFEYHLVLCRFMLERNEQEIKEKETPKEYLQEKTNELIARLKIKENEK